MDGKTLLLIDPDDSSQYIFGTILRLNGYRVVDAWSAVEGLQLAERHRPDLIVLDLALPDVNGFDMVRRLKSHPEIGAIPVLAATVHAFDHERDRAFASGCDHFLRKPLEPLVLVAAVERILARR